MSHAQLVFAYADAKKELFGALLILAHLFCAKLNGLRKLIDLR